jgi:hypothetical protein
MPRPSEPWAGREAGLHPDVAWGRTVMRDYGWPDQVFTTHYHGDDSEPPMLATGRQQETQDPVGGG